MAGNRLEEVRQLGQDGPRWPLRARPGVHFLQQTGAGLYGPPRGRGVGPPPGGSCADRQSQDHHQKKVPNIRLHFRRGKGGLMALSKTVVYDAQRERAKKALKKAVKLYQKSYQKHIDKNIPF